MSNGNSRFTDVINSARQRTDQPQEEQPQVAVQQRPIAASSPQPPRPTPAKRGRPAGGKRNGNYFEPTVLTDITPENEIYREELFGPVAQVYRVSSEEEAVTLSNDTPYGLGSYVMTNDPEQAERVANQLDAGMVYVNIVGADGAELPFGGTKRSGFGRELGRYGADEFVNKKLIRTG